MTPLLVAAYVGAYILIGVLWFATSCPTGPNMTTLGQRLHQPRRGKGTPGSPPMTSVFCEFPLEIAHSLPRMPKGHKCRRVHGHSYRVIVTFLGIPSSETGMLVDYADIEAAWMREVHAVLDHQNLNEVLNTDLTTSEHLAYWIGTAMAHHVTSPVMSLSSVEVWETRRFGARWTPTK